MIKTVPIKIKLPSYVVSVARVLVNEGHQVYLVGGVLRDMLLNRIPKDYDLATDAVPEIVLESFPKAIATGLKFGGITVLSRDEHGENHTVEVTTFRSDAKYVDGRWPTEVKFEKDIVADISRRDFTIGAFAVDLSQKGIEFLSDVNQFSQVAEWQMIDQYEGMSDIRNKIIRTVGNPIDRFSEDGLRAFKACRLASVLGFKIEKNTDDAIEKTINVSRMVSMERIRDEFMKILLNSPKPSVGIELMRKNGLLDIFFPELLECYGVAQPKFHTHDVYNHLLRAVDIAEDKVKLAILFHDIGKPQKSTGDGHFYGHDIKSAEITSKVMKRLRFSNAEIDRTVRLVKNHMFYYPHDTNGIPENKNEESNFNQWSDSAVRRFIRRVGEDLIEDLFALRIADAMSNPKGVFDPTEIVKLQERISEVRQKDMVLNVEDLDITGYDLMGIGIRSGPEMGSILSQLLELVIEDPKINERDVLLKKAKELQIVNDK